jgi:hypothetical protein
MAKIRVPVERLPPPDSNGNHVLQFRVVSEDRNRISPWSNLFVIKSIGQYRPLESDVTVLISEKNVSLTWDTPTIYNYNSASITSASIAHNHPQNFKQHDVDVFLKWDSQNFEYHERAVSDSTNIIIPVGASSIRAIGTVALKDIPVKESFEENQDYEQRLEDYLGVSGSTQGVYDLFKVFDTGVVTLF